MGPAVREHGPGDQRAAGGRSRSRAPAEEQPAAARARPTRESGEDLGWGVEDLGEDDDEGVWNDEPDTPSPHLETLTNYLQRHNPAKRERA